VLAVDTNVLVYAADADSQFHTACRDWLECQRARADARPVTFATTTLAQI
jgi:predicted nucleic acid-binding protein